MIRFLYFTLFGLGLLIPTVRAAEVTLREDRDSFEISNGELSATIAKRTARVTAVSLGKQSLLGDGTGYWSMAASSGRSRVGGFGNSGEQFVSIDPKSNGGERAEVACRFRGTGANGAYPGHAEVRYAIDRNSTTLYATAIMDHGAGDAPFSIGEGRFVIKLDAKTFDQLTIDQDRNWIMPTPLDWEKGTELNTKEARRLTTGIHAGWAEHKYSYSAILERVPAYGWLGTQRHFGAWMINPSVEYIAGGPTKMELTGHLDLGGDSLPTLLNMWHGSHYGGTVLTLAQDEKWTKVIGPFGIHFNQGGGPDELWKAALKQAAVERAAWPYAWVQHDAYPGKAGRGGLTGSIRIAETPAVPANSACLWVGLTAPDYLSRNRWSENVVGWQRDSKFYQYWVKATADGSFALSGVRPGTYVMHAFVDGVHGEYVQKDVTIVAGETKAAGELRWVPERAGPTLWEIGIPDRSAAEFRNGDRYWYWGNYLKFKTDFPDGVNYVVGKSDRKKDWHICQPLDLSPDWKVLGRSTWTVRFPLDKVPAGGTRLRVAFCGSRNGSSVDLLLNGAGIGGTGPLPENGTMHRDSHRGIWYERSYSVPAARLKEGENVLQFRLSGETWDQGVLYDYVRMEAVAAPAVAALENAPATSETTNQAHEKN